MYNLVSILSTILPIIATLLLTCVISINLFLTLRRKFPIRVNCWFCNSWTKVAYDDQNSFTCPNCTQYNGFTKDGDYNKIIPEQHDEFMNNKSSRVNPRKSSTTNGLCILCNNNQQLKVFQLAHFVPLVEENYDVEIEHFQKQLEKAYKLCKKCDKVLKNTITKQSALIFGNRLKSMCSNGISKVADKIVKNESKLSYLATMNGLVTISFVTAIILSSIAGRKTFTSYLSLYIPSNYMPLYEKFLSLLNTSKMVNLTMAPYFSRSLRLEVYSTFCGVSLGIEIIKLVCSKRITSFKVNHLLCWIILFLISWTRNNKNFSSYFLFIQGFSCIYLLATAFSYYSIPKESPKPSGKTMRKLVKNLETTCTDYTDTTSDFENTSSCSHHYESSRDSDCLNKSSYSNISVPQSQSFTANANNVLNSSFVPAKPHLDPNLHRSLSNLHLGHLNHPKPTFSVASYPMRRPKPVLSPPKLQSVNSWVAGGFWRESDGACAPPAQRTNLSRSSSESSGFGSQHNDNGMPRSDLLGDFDRLSVGPELGRANSPNYFFGQRVGSPGLFKLGEGPRSGFAGPNWSDNVNFRGVQSFKDVSLRSGN